MKQITIVFVETVTIFYYIQTQYLLYLLLGIMFISFNIQSFSFALQIYNINFKRLQMNKVAMKLKSNKK